MTACMRDGCVFIASLELDAICHDDTVLAGEYAVYRDRVHAQHA